MFSVLVGVLGALALVWPAAAQVMPFPGDFRTQAITTDDGATIYLRTGGQGPAVVLLHGFGDTGDMWAPLAAALARDHTVVVPDLRGMGLSSHPAAGYDKRTQAADVRAVLTHLGIERAAIIGHDIGTMVAYAYAARYPDTTAKLVVMDAPIPGIPPWDAIVRHPLLWHFSFGGPDAERLVAGRERIYLDRFWNEFAGDPTKIDEATRAHYAQLYARPGAMRRACADVERAFLVTNSTARTEHQQLAFTRVAHQSGVRHIVKLSQLHADPHAPGQFLRYHAAVEAAIQASGLTFTFLRPNLYMQGLLNFRQSIQEQNAFFAAAGDARISAVDMRDLADVAVAALTTAQHDNQSYALTGPEAVTFAAMAYQLSQAVGRTITFVDVPPEAMRAALVDQGFPAWQADGLLEEFAMYRRGEAVEVESGVRDALGRPPRAFAEFARDYAPLFT